MLPASPLPELRVSVLVATYRGVDHIRRCLDSLAAQDLLASAYADPHEDVARTAGAGQAPFEIVITLNGPRDGTAEIIDDFRAAHPELIVRTVRIPVAGAARARNAGLAAARGRFVTFVDDDDTVSPGYLSGLLALAQEDRIAVARVADVTEGAQGNRVDYDTYINNGLTPAVGTARHPLEARVALGFDAAKMVATAKARSIRVPEHMTSGQDVVYWATLANTYALPVIAAAPGDDCVYFRTLRSGSVSRADQLSYDFDVSQRLAVIEALAPIAEEPTGYYRQGARSAIASQTDFLRRYAEQHPDQRERIVADVLSRRISGFAWSGFNRDLGDRLVICYTFPPSADASGFVMGRRIRERGEIVDVIHHHLEPARILDPGSNELVAPYLDRRTTILGPPSFGGWPAIRQFANDGRRAIKRNERAKGTYQSIYSRAMWPASHVLAAWYKVSHPDVPWTAEFSDPLLKDTSALDRVSLLPARDRLVAEVDAAVVQAGFTPPGPRDWLAPGDPPQPVVGRNMWQWVEDVTYALADEFVFTNRHQLDYMLGYLTDPLLRERVRARAVVSPHPSPDPELYHLREVPFEADPDRIEIGYFGNFYATRTLTEVTGALRALPEADRARFKLHICTRHPKKLAEELADLVASGTVATSEFVPYLEFLNLASKYDVLLINDAATREHHDVNPYLPSKLSDYLGAGTPIWAIVEEGSILSETPTAYRSALGDTEGARAVLARLLAEPPRKETHR